MESDQQGLFNEDEYLRLLRRPKERPRRHFLGGISTRMVMRMYAWCLAAAPVLACLGPRHLNPVALRVLVFAAGVAAVIYGVLHRDTAVTIIGAGGVLASILEARSAARSRVIIGGFEGIEASAALNSARIGDLLRVELARLSDLFQTVRDQRAVSSGIGPKRALDATLSVDRVASALQAAVSADAKLGWGPLSVPWRLVIAVADQVTRPPRLSGTLHADDSGLIVTAQQDGLDGLSWRVPPVTDSARAHTQALSRGGDSPRLDDVSPVLKELALRIFTDLALGRSVRWQAGREFVEGLDHVRACLRAPIDRKVNLRKAEQRFLRTLAEDEDFPHAYYNLGVVYTELFTLAWASGRTIEARHHHRAAEISFGQAVERDPHRWENYFALAQTRFQNRDFGDVIAMCERMDELKWRGVVNHAKTRELQASALLFSGGDRCVEKANKHARRAVRWATFAALRGRFLPGFYSREDELAAACLQTFGLVQARFAWREPKLWFGRVGCIYQRARSLVKENAELRVELGLLGLGAWVEGEGGRRRRPRPRRGLIPGRRDRSPLGVARGQLHAAWRSDPSRPLYCAAFAAALSAAKLADPEDPTLEDAIKRVHHHSRVAAESLSQAYAPARDRAAVDLIVQACAPFKPSWRVDDLPRCRDRADELLASHGTERDDASDYVRDSGAIVSAAFLQALRDSPAAPRVLDDYGKAVQRAQQLLRLLRARSMRDTAEAARSVDEMETGATDRALGPKSDIAEIQREALREAERATLLNPLSVLAWMTLGDIHQELADYANARVSWGNAQTQDPDNPALYDRLGTSWWNLAFQGRARPEAAWLEKAKVFFEKAQLLYETGPLEAQLRTRYRLGKLNVALGEFDAARAQFGIVEAAGKKPLVGWVQLGLAHLERKEYADAEWYFERVILCGAELDAGAASGRSLTEELDPEQISNHRPRKICGNRIDERDWPLAVVRAWGHLGLALSYATRDGDLGMAKRLLENARWLVLTPSLDKREYQVRIPAACDDCEGYIALKEGELELAIVKLEEAVRRNPYSRSYLNLARSYVAVARTSSDQEKDYHRMAKRCVDHAISLDPDHEATEEIADLLDEVAALA
jgi:tetratricopeptide (TPR) repeat protein